MANKLKIRRGLKANLPTLSVGEQGLCTDTSEIFIGGSTGNIQLANKEYVDTQLAQLMNDWDFGLITSSPTSTDDFGSIV